VVSTRLPGGSESTIFLDTDEWTAHLTKSRLMLLPRSLFIRIDPGMLSQARSRPLTGVGRVVSAIVGVTVLWCGVAAFIANRLTDEQEARMISREQQVAEAEAALVKGNIATNLDHLQFVPTILAKEPSLISALDRFGPDAQPTALPSDKQRAIWQADPQLSALSRNLNSLVPEVVASQFLVINAAGDCIASGGFTSNSTDATGVNYSDREYFRAGKEGRHGRQFAVGRTTRTPGLYYSSPVYDGGRFLGVVTVKQEVQNIAFLVRDVNAFISDENGVIILAHDPRLLMRALPGALIYSISSEDRQKRYLMTDFLQVNMSQLSRVGETTPVNWEDEPTPFVMAVQTRADGFLTTHILRSISELGTVRNDGIRLFAFLFSMGTLLILLVGGVVVFFYRNTTHQRELAKLNEELARQAGTDSLTGCANRRQFLAMLAAELQRAERYDYPVCVICLDLDHFKKINDGFGHAGGDEALRHFSAVTRSSLRSSDVVGRLGGEEFTILLPETAIEGATLVALRIRANVEALAVPFADTAIAMTVSCGIAQWRNGETQESLLNRADEALYQAKALGRNRVQSETSASDETYTRIGPDEVTCS
jgi:diguanylate cyclase (GGDEF)-like protein